MVTVEGAEEGIGIRISRDLGIRGGKDGEEEGRDLLVLQETIGGAVHLRDGLDLWLPLVLLRRMHMRLFSFLFLSFPLVFLPPFFSCWV